MNILQNMPQVSRNKLPKKTEETLVKNLNIVFSQIIETDAMLLFLNSLLTETEKLMLAKRLAMVFLLSENVPDTYIASTLHVTRMTVAKMRYYNEAHGEGFIIALKKLEEQKRLRQFKKVLLSLVRYSVRAAGGYVKPTIFD
jgi:Trp operon repressor